MHRLRALLFVSAALLLAAAVAEGKDTKWTVWSSSGSQTASGSTSWWVRVQDGATSFFASTRGFFLGRGAGGQPAPPAQAAPQIGVSRTAPARQPWFSGIKPGKPARGSPPR
jgi:hypothetical protein